MMPAQNISLLIIRCLWGAGVTVAAKIKFETWPWETTRVSVKHHHSDNSVFTAGLYNDSCKEERWSQNLSGVGAQHHNSGLRNISKIWFAWIDHA